MKNGALLALACVLLVVRLPSLVQPMGADQGLYAYIGDRILDGGLPYRDAWDQKPPAIHVAYAMMRAVLPRDAVVPAADLVVAALVAVLLWRLDGTETEPRVGPWSAVLFLFLSNPAFARLGGVAVRAQCETFIAAAVTGAFLCLARSRSRSGPMAVLAAGVLFGVAFAFKYNAATYALAGVLAMWLWRVLNVRTLALLAVGFTVPAAALLIWFAAGGATRDMYDATILYNVHYSGETYQGPLHFLGYLFTFPVRHARVDALWLLGSAGCAVLLFTARTDLRRLIPVAWVAAACLTIAINGSRDLPQYFVQAAPALALAAAWAGRVVFTRTVALSILAAVLVAVGVWRVNDFAKLADNTWRDARYAFGGVAREEHLGRYGDRATRKYSALAMNELGTFMQSHSDPSDTVYVFGFSSAAYVIADRASASRFFWSRPVIVGFNDGKPGYGVAGLLDDLSSKRPAVVALQQRDWYPDVDDSAHFFMATPALAGWLRAAYTPTTGPEGFDLWIRRLDAR